MKHTQSLNIEALREQMHQIIAAADRHGRLNSEHLAYARLHEAQREVLGIELSRLEDKLDLAAKAKAAAVAAAAAPPHDAGNSAAAAAIIAGLPRAGSADGEIQVWTDPQSAPQSPAKRPTPRRTRPAAPAAPEPKATATAGEPVERVDPAKLAAVRALPEPFGSGTLKTMLNMGSKEASNLLVRWKKKGWLESPKRGEWQRTANYPKAGANA